MVQAVDSARVRVLARGQGPERAQAPAREQVRALAPASLREQSERVRRFHKWTLRWPQSPEIPLLAKSAERWT